MTTVKYKHIYAPAKYRENMNAESLFCCWAIRQPRERAAARGKDLRLSQFAVSISVKWGEKIVEEMGLQLEKNRLHDLMEAPYILITFPLGQIICDNLDKAPNYQNSLSACFSDKVINSYLAFVPARHRLRLRRGGRVLVLLARTWHAMLTYII